MNIQETPVEFHQDLFKTLEFLNSQGYNEIYLFGSLAKNEATKDSDIDIAVRGIKPKDFFNIYGELLMLTTHSLDLIDLDLQKSFGDELISNGELKRVS